MAALPRATAAAWLADRITTMPLGVQAIGEASATAARLVLLLPSQLMLRTNPGPGTFQAGLQPLEWVVVAAMLGALAIGVATSTWHGSVSPAPDAADRIVRPDQ